MNRAEKIKFLSDITQGKRSAKELSTPARFKIYDEIKELFADEHTGKIYTHDEVKSYVKKSPFHYITLTLVTRNKETDKFKSHISHYFTVDHLKNKD